ncbi:polyphosphate polymerase domain-containing protein [Corynebacterium kozikiae]|uniref:polyphosphate polymerase domain-containing protein n=1 Tax=Corynebacterium kozikiae TaxID=2968469 RepID=UPI00211C2D10|nr:polyphosphate polymerase domain-containing protein [Corynebacterium sp. 76QC2CO]MCQ9344205.1 polyphosphate polymerase domain-containing protein [Corynebacterium sp. 76QC2CO]
MLSTAHSPALDFSELQPISLEELISQAAMLTRVDRKYVLPRGEVQRIIQGLDPNTKTLVHNQKVPQAYRSTYFDTPGLTSFYMAARPRRRKFKVRTRSYVDSKIAFLEVKGTGPRGVTVKERIPYNFEAAMSDELLPDVIPWLGSKLELAGMDANTAWDLHPVLWGSYNRSTLLMADGVGRATIDTDLDWANHQGAYLDRPDMAIFETKSGASPSQLDRLLWAYGHRPQKISKFGTGMAALDPSLPRNRWHRIIEQSFK